MRENGSKNTNKVLLIVFIILFVIAAALFTVVDPFDIFHLGLKEKIFPTDEISTGEYVSPQPGSGNIPSVSASGTERCTHPDWYVLYTESPATCVRSGIVRCRCSVCGDEWTMETGIDPNNHVGGTNTKNGYDATWNSDGYSGDVYCSSCNDYIRSGHTISATGGNYDGDNRLIVTNCKGVNIRRQGNSGSDKVGHLDQGAVVTYSGSFSYGSKAYVQIQHSGGSGYVNTNDSANPFVVRFSEYYSSPKKISMNNGTNLYLLPDGSTSSRNKVAAADSGRQYTCIGKVNGIGTSSSYYVVKCDSKCKYTDPDSGNKYTIQYAFVREGDVKNIK